MLVMDVDNSNKYHHFICMGLVINNGKGGLQNRKFTDPKHIVPPLKTGLNFLSPLFKV